MVNVIVIKESVVYENILCKDANEAEEVFLSKCHKHISNFNEYSSQDIKDILDQGYEKFGGNCSICISWPLS